jgi:transposase
MSARSLLLLQNRQSQTSPARKNGHRPPLTADPFAGDIFIFRAKRADRIKLILWDGSGLCLVTKRLEAGGFIWPPVQDGAVTLSTAQLRLLFYGMDWTQIPARSAMPVRSTIAAEKLLDTP